ncbi:MAG: terminase small subunit [Clostridiales bacterium]|nr:terminase small subunit [Clostridiales bacterium]
MDRLTDKQRAWIDYYKQGLNPREAAEKAGYKATSKHSFEQIGFENLKKLEMYLKDRDAELDKSRIASMEDINAFWTEVMNNKEETTANRLKASELRARSAGGFVDNVNVHGGAPAVVVLSGEAEIKD